MRRGEESWLTGASIHTPKSATARRWHRQKNNKSLPIHDRGSATLYLWRQNKGRPVEHSDCVYFPKGTMPLRGGGKDWCGTWGPFRKKKKRHFIWIHREFKKTAVALCSIWIGGFECEEADEGKEFKRQEIVEVAMTWRKKCFLYDLFLIQCLCFFLSFFEGVLHHFVQETWVLK